MEDEDAEDPELQHALAMSLEDKPGMLQMLLISANLLHLFLMS